MTRRVNYNLAVTISASSQVHKYVFPAFLAVSVVALSGASCDKQSAASPEAGEGSESARA
jgi:hypothetical protein